MALDPEPHTGTSQYYINVVDNTRLDFKAEEKGKWGYCAFGRVIEGMDIVDRISQMVVSKQDDHEELQTVPVTPVVILTARLLLKKEEAKEASIDIESLVEIPKAILNLKDSHESGSTPSSELDLNKLPKSNFKNK